MDNSILADACNIKTGKLDSNQAVKGGQYPFFTCSSLPDTIDRFAFDEDVVLVAGNNAQGNFHISRFKGKFNAYQRTYILTSKPNYDIDFIFYSLKLELKRLKEKSQGSQTKFLTMPILNNIVLRKLNLSQQQKTASVLSSLDSKIELNNRINAELESMAKTLYDYWFVQFDFPDENGKPYKSSGGKMVWNEELKREIPDIADWKVTTLSNAVNIFDSKRIPLSNMEREKRKGKYPYYGATSIMDYVDDYIFDGEYILLAEDGSVMDENGFPIVQYIWGKTWVNNHAHILQHKNELNNNFLFYLLKSISVIQIMTGSIQKKINQENLLNVKVIYPDNHTLESFSKISTSIRKKLITIYEENQQLSELRDWLLPMLMNGQVSVKGDEEEMGNIN